MTMKQAIFNDSLGRPQMPELSRLLRDKGGWEPHSGGKGEGGVSLLPFLTILCFGAPILPYLSKNLSIESSGINWVFALPHWRLVSKFLEDLL